MKGLTEKFQSGYPDLGKTIDIYTDENAIMTVEEATGSPVRSNKSENHEKFEKVNKQKFSDEILFRKSSKSEKNSRMTQSAYSISSGSNSSGERDQMPVFMTSSFNGVLPDIRSLDTIKCDIQEKEKMLEKMLDLDKVEIPDISRLEKITHDFETSVDTRDSPTNSFRNYNILEEIEAKRTARDSPKLVSSNKEVASSQKKGDVKRLISMEDTKAPNNESFVGVPCEYFSSVLFIVRDSYSLFHCSR